jgi:hypothetical protein
MPFRVEMWDSDDQHIRWVAATCDTVSVAHGAFDAAIKTYPNYRWKLRNGMLVLRKHEPSAQTDQIAHVPEAHFRLCQPAPVLSKRGVALRRSSNAPDSQR